MRMLSTLFFAVLLMAAAGPPAIAQHQQHHAQQNIQAARDTTRQDAMMGMMQGDMMGMMHQMMDETMQDPLRHAAVLVHVLPTMQDPLGLSADQTQQLEQEKQAFLREEAGIQDQRSAKQQQLDDLLAAGEADPPQVKGLLKDLAARQADYQALNYETATRMQAVLSAAQREKLSAMTPMQLHHHMMANMTMMEMMQAMQGAMMPCGMMQSDRPDMMGNMMGSMMEGAQNGTTMRRTERPMSKR